jgi:glutathione S-transferase
MRLITIRPSHYNERARWALDRFGLAYVEQAYMPMLHVAAVAAAVLPAGAGRADRGSTRLSTPVLIDAGQVIADSGEILGWVDRRHGDSRTSLRWSPRSLELEQTFAERLGPDARRLAYHYIIDDARGMRELAERNVPRAQAKLFAAMLPVGRRLIRDKLRIDEEHVARSLARIEATFDDIEARLADGRPYLLGDRFSGADLTFAALASLVVLVQPSEGYAAWLPPVDQAPPEFAALIRRTRERPAGRFILRMFAEERGRRIIPCEPLV